MYSERYVFHLKRIHVHDVLTLLLVSVCLHLLQLLLFKSTAVNYKM
jgi:hypothetical protein